MWDLRKEVMDDMGSYVMVDVINPSIVAIKSCKPTPKVAPFLSNIMKDKSCEGRADFENFQ